MIHPRQQWCVQIDVTNACPRKCSNCTRLLAHARKPFFMDMDTFERACAALSEFPTASEPDLQGRRKVVGIIGGEPLIHPEFEQIVAIMCHYFPDPSHRGLWTGLQWRDLRHRTTVEQLLGGEPSYCVNPGDTTGYLNENFHDREHPSAHQPALVAVRDVIEDGSTMWKLIDQCWMQSRWASAVTPKGFFFCEVAAAFDMIFGGPGGKPLDSDCWRGDIDTFRDQIERWCPQCGFCLYDNSMGKMAVPGLPSRLDYEEIDDVSVSNWKALVGLRSPRMEAGRCVLYSAEDEKVSLTDRKPWRYRQ